MKSKICIFRKWLDLISSQRVGKDIHENFHRELDDQQDKFGVIAEFLGRRLFDKVMTQNFLFQKQNQSSLLGINNTQQIQLMISM
jgi:hypothetical protein